MASVTDINTAHTLSAILESLPVRYHPNIGAGLRSSLLLVCVVTPAFSQLLSVGIKAGVPLDDAVSTSDSFTHGTRRYVLGGTVEARLPFRLSIELDALYRRIGFDYAFQSLDLGRFSSRTTANQWDFPLLGKYEILGGPVRPFVDAGPVLRHLSNINEASMQLVFYPYLVGVFSSMKSNNSIYLRHRNSAGFTAGAGIAANWRRLRASPEIRYTRWGNEAFAANQFGNLNSNLNQVDLLVGLTF
jgi:opacity protein-like surface antigen